MTLIKTPIKESFLEDLAIKQARVYGMLCRKYVSPGHRGVPDRLFVDRQQVFFIEFKSTGAKLSPLQVLEINRMRDHDALVFVVDNRSDLEAILLCTRKERAIAAQKELYTIY